MSLWDWALAAWSKPDVERNCLELQDRAGHSIALLLWWAWMLAEGRPADAELAHSGVELVAPIETDILRPLRAARRALAKEGVIDDKMRIEARQKIRTTELVLERALLDALAAIAPAPARCAESDLAAALVPIMQAWSGTPPIQEERAFAAAFAKSLSGAVV